MDLSRYILFVIKYYITRGYGELNIFFFFFYRIKRLKTRKRLGMCKIRFVALVDFSDTIRVFFFSQRTQLIGFSHTRKKNKIEDQQKPEKKIVSVRRPADTIVVCSNRIVFFCH